jgi:hypothetical protein
MNNEDQCRIEEERQLLVEQLLEESREAESSGYKHASWVLKRMAITALATMRTPYRSWRSPTLPRYLGLTSPPEG